MHITTPKVLSFFGALLCAVIIQAVGFSGNASAAYDGARIIDDAVFLNSNAMGINDIQNHLASKGSGLASMSFVLNCYGADSQERQWYTSVGAPCDQTIPASHMIYYASKIYGINPQVVLATLQKEQSLITSPNPTTWQLNHAMGYGCPTTGECEASTFFYQIDSGIWVLRYHYERARGNNSWWRPSTSWTCGTEKNFYKPNLYPGQNVTFYDEDNVPYRTYYIVNPATSSLYCYTPHAYNNPQGLYGRAAFGTTGRYYSGSYNFVTYFELWFGSTGVNFGALGDPRWMQLNTDTQKVSAVTSAPVESTLANGLHLKIYSKIYLNGQWCYRTAHDTTRSIPNCIPANHFSELNIVKSALSTIEQYQEIKSPVAYKSGLRRDSTPSTGLYLGQQIPFVSKTTVGGITYYLTAHDDSKGIELGIAASNLQPSTAYEAITPRWMKLQSNTNKILTSNGSTVTAHPSGLTVKFSSRVLYNGSWHYRTAHDTAKQFGFGIPEAALTDQVFDDFVTPRWMEVKDSTTKMLPLDNTSTEQQVTQGTHIKFAGKLTVNGVTYFQTEHDRTNSIHQGVASTRVKDINFVPLVVPRSLKLSQDLQKIVPSTGETVDGTLPEGLARRYTSKIQVNGIWYLRTQTDTNDNMNKGIPLEYLAEL